MSLSHLPRLFSQITLLCLRFHLRRAFDDWNRRLESIRVEQLLENPGQFLRAKQPLSLPVPSSEPAQHRHTVSAGKNGGETQVGATGTGIGASKVAAAPSDFDSVSSFLQGLWASTNGELPLHSSGSWKGISNIFKCCAALRLCGRGGNSCPIGGNAARLNFGPGCVQRITRATFGCTISSIPPSSALFWNRTAVLATQANRPRFCECRVSACSAGSSIVAGRWHCAGCERNSSSSWTRDNVLS